MDEERVKEYRIPRNYSGSGKILDLINKRNLAEAVVVFFAIYYILCKIPFTSQMRMVLVAAVDVPLLIWFGIGINDESILQHLCGWVKYKRNRKNARIKLHVMVREKQGIKSKVPRQKFYFREEVQKKHETYSKRVTKKPDRN